MVLSRSYSMPWVLISLTVLLGTSPNLTADTIPLFQIHKQTPIYPQTITELQSIVQQAATLKNTKIAVVGADKSQGGQTISSNPSIRINLKKMNKLIALDIRHKQVTVEAGMTWAELEQHIAPHRLSIKAMQSYNDFSIGGSLGVNVHGQDFRYAPLIETVISCKIVLADGTIKNISRTENPELFSLAIGGYGLFGIIYEVTLSLTDDVMLQRNATVISTDDLCEHFITNIKHNPAIEFYSARFSVGSTDLLDKTLVITYESCDHKDNTLFALTPPAKENLLGKFLKLTGQYCFLKNIRFALETIYCKVPQHISRNNLLNCSINALPQDGKNCCYILQEYFIPYAHMNQFIEALREIVKNNNINLINITARHVHRNTQSILSYSHDEVCAFVLYINIDKKESSYNHVHQWTQQLIEEALKYNGAFYLPYHLLATKEQVRAAYPRFQEFVDLKRTYDPKELFSNMLYETYA